ncbi:unnamed protein product, partial [marine sediment metagenome]
AIINLVKNDRISDSPDLAFEVTGADSNPAQILLDILEGNGNYFNPGLNIPSSVNRQSFLDSIAFCNAEGFECNTAILDGSYGETEQALKESGSLLLLNFGGIYNLRPETKSDAVAELWVTDDVTKDSIVRDSWSLESIDETTKFNVLRVTYQDAENDYISRDIVIDVTGEVDTINGVLPQIIENGSLIDISDSESDFLRASTRNFPAVTSRAQALKLGIQEFKKQNLINFAFSFEVSIRHSFLEV